MILLLLFYFEFIITITALVIRLPINKQQQFNNNIYELINKKRRGLGYESLYYDMQSLYLIQIAIGTPKQIFSVSIDTGSADLWIPSKQCPVTSCPGTKFDTAVSTTFNDTGLPFNITYGNGYVNGNYIIESVTMGSLTVQQQQLGLASYTNNIFNHIDTSITNKKKEIQSGILGLGFPSLTVAASEYRTPYLPFLFQLIQQKSIDQPIFSIYLNNSNRMDDDGWDHGELVLGGYNPKKFLGDIHYVSVINPPPPTLSQWNGYWMVASQGYIFSKKTNNNNNNNNNSPDQQQTLYQYQQLLPTILDTGAMISHFPLQITQSILNDIFGNQSSTSNIYQYDTSTGHFIFPSSSSSLSLCQSLRDQYQHFTLQLLIPSTNQSQPIIIQVPIPDLFVSFKQTCVFGIAVTSSSLVGNDQPLLIFGDSILKSTYLVFDIGQNQVGFATPNHNGTVIMNNSNNNNNSSNGNKNNSNNNSGTNVTNDANVLPSHLFINYIYLFIFVFIFIV